MAGRLIRSSGAKRAVAWSNILTSMSVVANSGSKTLGTSIGLSLFGGDTLIRTRGWASFHFDPTSIADSFNVGIALGLYSDDAFAAGAASMPGPLSDAGYDWIFHTTRIFGPTFTATEDGTNILHNVWLDVDSKAMRKVKPNQTLAWISEGAIISGGGSFDCSVSTRHLFKFG